MSNELRRFDNEKSGSKHSLDIDKNKFISKLKRDKATIKNNGGKYILKTTPWYLRFFKNFSNKFKAKSKYYWNKIILKIFN